MICGLPCLIQDTNVSLLLVTAKGTLVLLTTRTRNRLLAGVRLVHTIRIRHDGLSKYVIAYGAHVTIRLTSCLTAFEYCSRSALFARHVPRFINMLYVLYRGGVCNGSAICSTCVLSMLRSKDLRRYTSFLKSSPSISPSVTSTSCARGTSSMHTPISGMVA